PGRLLRLGPDRSFLPESPEAESVSVHRLQLPAEFLQFTLDSFSIGLGSQLRRFRLAQGLGHQQSLLFGLAFFRFGLAFFRFGLAFFRFGLSKSSFRDAEGLPRSQQLLAGSRVVQAHEDPLPLEMEAQLLAGQASLDGLGGTPPSKARSSVPFRRNIVTLLDRAGPC